MSFSVLKFLGLCFLVPTLAVLVQGQNQENLTTRYANPAVLTLVLWSKKLGWREEHETGNALNDRERDDVLNDVVLKDVTDDDVDDVANVSTTYENATKRRGGEQLLNEIRLDDVSDD